MLRCNHCISKSELILEHKRELHLTKSEKKRVSDHCISRSKSESILKHNAELCSTRLEKEKRMSDNCKLRSRSILERKERISDN